MNALYTVFNICREVIFVPGSIENWILIIETAEMSMMAFPYDVFMFFFNFFNFFD